MTCNWIKVFLLSGEARTFTNAMVESPGHFSEGALLLIADTDGVYQFNMADVEKYEADFPPNLGPIVCRRASRP